MKLLKWFVSLALILSFGLFVPVADVFSQSAVQDEEEALPAEQADWKEDISDKIDKTVEVLGVVKEELKEMKEKEALEGEKPPIPGEGVNWADKIRGKVSAAIRIWRKVRETIKTETEKAKQEAAIEKESEAEWARDLSDKLDKTMQAITVIQEELKEIEEESAAPGEEK